MMPDMSIIVLSGIANVLTVMAVYGYLKVQGVADEVAEPGDMNLIVVLIAVAAAIVAIALTTFLAGLLATMFGPQGLSVSDGFTHQLQTASRAELLRKSSSIAAWSWASCWRVAGRRCRPRACRR